MTGTEPTPGPWSEARARCDAAFRWPFPVPEFLPSLIGDLRAALDAIDAVLALHRRYGCKACLVSYPCPTVRALGVTE